MLVDIAIDQGWLLRGLTPDHPTRTPYRVHDSVFFWVANMPGAVPRTSTFALTNATLPYVVALADLGWRRATTADRALAAGLSTHDGAVLSRAVAAAHAGSCATRAHFW